MLSNTDLVTKVVYPMLAELMSGFSEQVTIIEDNQDAPRPLNREGYINNYLFFKVLPLKQIMWPRKKLINNNTQRTYSQYEMTVTLNMLGTLANDVNNYLVDACASILGSYAFNQDGVQIYYTNLTDPIDLTSIENSKWVKRVQRNMVFGYRDHNDFAIDSFDRVESETIIDNGVTQKVIVIKSKGESNGI